MCIRDRLLEKLDSSIIQDNDRNGVPEIYDPWRRAEKRVLDYWYAAGDNFPRLICAGPDRIFNTADDITNR